MIVKERRPGLSAGNKDPNPNPLTPMHLTRVLSLSLSSTQNRGGRIQSSSTAYDIM